MTHQRIEVDREDLLAEATALVDRVEWQVSGFAEPIVIGFRRSGDASIYLGADPVYQFTAAGALRRAYADGQLIKAVRGRLVAMTRHRTESLVELRSRELTADEQASLLGRLGKGMAAVRDAACAGQFNVRGAVSDGPRQTDGAAAHARAIAWLQTLELPPAVAAAPNAGR